MSAISNPLISIIVPVYKVEKYLERCVYSLINQTYRNIEIILVDDGSPDHCPQMCDHYAKNDTRIRVVHKPNGGLSSARNAGLREAIGAYVAFVDSDDWVNDDTYEYCLKLINQFNADAVQFEITFVSKNSKEKPQPKEKVSVFKDKEVLEYYLYSSTRKSGGFAVWRCLFSSNIAKRYSFRESKINEDIDYKYQVLHDCAIFVVSNQYKYQYWQGGDSISMGGLKRQDFDLYESANLLADYTSKETYGNIAFLGQVKKARTAFSLLCKIAYFGVDDPSIDKKDVVNKLVNEHRKNCAILLKAPLSLSRKILSVMFAISFSLSEFLLSLIKK